MTRPELFHEPSAGWGDECDWSPTGAHAPGMGRDRMECAYCDTPLVVTRAADRAAALETLALRVEEYFSGGMSTAGLRELYAAREALRRLSGRTET